MVDFELPDTEGKQRKLSDWKGKTIVLNFWATWCPPCREEIPLLVDTHDKYKSDGVVVIGVAIDTDRGLLVPVVRDVLGKGLEQINGELRELADRAMAGQSLPDDLTGGTFTITNLGMFEIDGFTPIINQPQAAILGVGRIVAKPVVVDNAVVVRQMLILSLSFDHRLVDGGPAARFLQRLKQLVERPFALLLSPPAAGPNSL